MNTDYWIKIEYKTGSKNPERVFKTMSGLIESFTDFDNNLAKIISANIATTSTLEEITTGSLKTRLGSILREIDDAALKELNWRKFVGSFLVKGKYKLIEFLEDKDTVNEYGEIELLNNDLVSLAREVDILHLPSYGQIPSVKLLENIKNISDAVIPLTSDDSVKLIVGDNEKIINQRFRLPAEKIEKLLTEQIIETERELVLKVKKPDFLGYSKWEMKIGNKTILVKIEDQNWLNRFHKQREPVQPGDSIKGLVRLHEHIDQHGQIVTEDYSILRVDEIITNLSYQQKLL